MQARGMEGSVDEPDTPMAFKKQLLEAGGLTTQAG